MPVPISSLSGVLNTARLGLYASQAAIRVTGNNIANVNTPGYARQRVILDPSRFGDGVNVRLIQSLRNQFFDRQLANEREVLGQAASRQSALSRAELIFDETSGVGINTAMGELFQGIQDLTAGPDGTAERESVRSRAEALARVFGSVRSRLEQVRQDTDDEVMRLLTQINGLAAQIADLNSQITRQSADQPPNELIDERLRLVGELSELVGVQVIDDKGSLTILTAGGQTLVEGSKSATLSAQPNAANEGLNDVYFTRFDGQRVNISKTVQLGRLGGALDVRDKDLAAQLRQLDQLSAQFVTEFNLRHRQGTGLDGITDRDFWEMAQVSSRPGANNQGGVGATASAIVDQSLLTFHDYEIRFTSPTAYDIVDATTGTTISAGNAYAGPTTAIFDGLSLTLDSASGPPQAGDVIRVNSYTGTASNMRLSAAVLADLSAIAAGQSAEPGDNRNALNLAMLESDLVLRGGTATFSDVFAAQVSTLGVSAQQAERMFETQNLVVQQVASLVDSVSGVSIDEESTNLIQFERAFQASSRLAVVVDEMLQTIVNLV